MRRLAAVAAIVALAVLTACSIGVPACEWETGEGQAVCVWDGRTQGNGEGSIVLNLMGGEIQLTLW